MNFGDEKRKKWKIQICILYKNEKFEGKKCAYFFRKLRGKGSFKPFFIFVDIPPQGAGRERFSLKNAKSEGQQLLKICGTYLI
jgi:hypothetical protein